MRNTGTQTFGNLIRSRRKELALTQEELAERLGEGIRQLDIARLERGYGHLPPMRELRLIAHELELEVFDVFVAAGFGTAVPAVVEEVSGGDDVDNLLAGCPSLVQLVVEQLFDGALLQSPTSEDLSIVVGVRIMPRRQPAKNLRIAVLVEHDADVETSLKMILHGEGYHVLSLPDFPQIKDVKRLQPELTMIGFAKGETCLEHDFVQALRADPETSDLALMVLRDERQDVRRHATKIQSFVREYSVESAHSVDAQESGSAYLD
jgi:transcriptional regulator with XRE-family HTH domain